MINYIVGEDVVNKINDMVWKGFECESRCAPYEMLTAHPLPNYCLSDLILGMQQAVSNTSNTQLDTLCLEAGWTRSIIGWWKKDPNEAIAICKEKGWLK